MDDQPTRLRRWATREYAWRLLGAERRPRGKVRYIRHWIVEIFASRAGEERRVRNIINELGARK